MSELDLDALEKVARKATPGPWRSGSARFGYDVTETPYVEPEGGLYNVAQMYNAHFAMPDARHVATFNPVTALALIARIRELEAHVSGADIVKLAECEKKLDAVRELHVPGEYMPPYFNDMKLCLSCRTWWPCNTIEVLGGAE